MKLGRDKYSMKKVQEGLKEFRKANIERLFADYSSERGWSLNDWLVAVTGEVGEVASLLKLRRKGEDIAVEEIGKELADVVTYIDLLSHKLGIDLGEALCKKFNEVSVRVGSRQCFVLEGRL